MEFKHYSVMLNECLKFISPKAGGIYLDGTLGGGGHTEEILRQSEPSGIVIGVDRDLDALASTKQRLAVYSKRLYLKNDNFKNVNEILDSFGIDLIDGAILDLGVSSYQLDNFNRGFSYRATDAPLDMRMDANNNFSAYNVINDYGLEKMTKVFFDYGEEKFSKKIASNIIKQRAVAPIKTCGELVDIIISSIPAAARRTGGHPAKRVFQAVRIEVNRELEGLDKAVMDITRRLKVGGRICILTFHSLEDRIVKHTFKEMELDCVCDKSAPICTCGKVKEIKVLTNKPIVASSEELEINSRSKSAKLRVAERL